MRGLQPNANPVVEHFSLQDPTASVATVTAGNRTYALPRSHSCCSITITTNQRAVALKVHVPPATVAFQQGYHFP
ncbi:MAG: hypothetical protein IPN89_17450 [Saprospiraceae bacterium]|nr:hypothetical protein [Saprospiraceae bacterium]